MRAKPTALRSGLAVCIFLLSLLASAQQKKITGSVTDANNQPVPGASIVIKGTTSGTTTDDQGRFTIMVPNNQSVLVVSAIGSDPKEVSVSGLTTVNVSLVSTLATLNE